MSKPNRIMVTLADNRATQPFVTELLNAGMTSIRINSAHVDPEGLTRIVETVRAVAPTLPILMDTKGPELRTNAPESPFTLRRGDAVMFGYGTAPCTPSTILSASSPDICKPLAPGLTVKIDDATIELEVIALEADGLARCRTTRGATIDARKTIALPGDFIPDLPAVSDRDRMMIQAGVEAGIDMIAHSFVRSRKDVEEVRSLIAGTPIELYAKIECREGIGNMREIARAADGLLVARGDLSAAVGIYELPLIQFRALKLCRELGRRSIVATTILQSMMSSPEPMRAEVSDIFTAFCEGADTLLLTGETAQGRYPVECVEVIKKTLSFISE